MDAGKLSSEQLVASTREAELVNKRIHHGKDVKMGGLDKDAFLKLLTTQLRHQDPTRPMEDREFIAQMAQFSTLEQMTNMNKEIVGMVRSARSAEAFSLLGKHVDSYNAESNRRVSGVVSAIQFANNEHVLVVGNDRIGLADIHAVRRADDAENGTKSTVLNDATRREMPVGGGAPAQ